MNDEARYIAEFNDRGEAYVREQFEKKRFDEFKMRLANHWLAERERSRNETSHAENAALARSAADAARDQADAAREANRIAEKANIIATLAMIAAVIAIGVSFAALLTGN